MTTPNVFYLHPLPTDTPALRVAKEKMGRAVVEQYEEVGRLMAEGVDVGCFALAFLGHVDA